MSARFPLTAKLINAADAAIDNRSVQISDAALRAWRREVHEEQMRVNQHDKLIGYEAVCLVACLSELAFARSEGDLNRELRAAGYLNPLRAFMRIDLERAERRELAQ
jgi:hypothetical protein